MIIHEFTSDQPQVRKRVSITLTLISLMVIIVQERLLEHKDPCLALLNASGE
jgi:hypothetical protein